MTLYRSIKLSDRRKLTKEERKNLSQDLEKLKKVNSDINCKCGRPAIYDSPKNCCVLCWNKWWYFEENKNFLK